MIESKAAALGRLLAPRSVVIVGASANTDRVGGRLVTVYSYCFRHEPSMDPARLQSFRMREFIRLGAPEEVFAWREAWIARGAALSHFGSPTCPSCS